MITEALNNLLQDEKAALATYNDALSHFTEGPSRGQIRLIQDLHSRNILALRNLIQKHNGIPRNDITFWDSCRNALQSAASLLGQKAVALALGREEERLQRIYHRALENRDLDDGCRSVIHASLLPQINRALGHLEELQTHLRQKAG